jgi:hypothetical protein
MSGLLNNNATLYRRMADDYTGPDLPPAVVGTVRDCAVFLREQGAGERECFFAELNTGNRLSALEIERIADSEGA